MKTPIPLACLLAAALGVQAASPYIYTYTSPTLNAPLPDASLSGYATSTDLPLPPGLVVSRVEVTLNISGGFNGDIYGYLWHQDPSHLVAWSVLLNRSGRTDIDHLGYADAGFSITLADTATTDIHNYGGAGGGTVSGQFKPDARAVNPLTATLDSPRTAFLNAFQGLAPNGPWVLFLADAAGGDTATLSDWGLRLELIPEPTPVLAPSALALLTLVCLRLNRRFLSLPAAPV
jgi:subtilisin-like proprotein convertase family protein